MSDNGYVSTGDYFKVGPANSISKCLVEAFKADGQCFWTERFDPFESGQSSAAIGRLLEFKGFAGNREKELERLRVEVQIAVQGDEKTAATFEGIDASELAEYLTAEPDWIVEGVFSAEQPAVFGGPSKACKTSQLVDLAVSLTTQTSWLGHFPAGKRRKVLFITGESNKRACSRRIYRALKARGLEWEDLKGWLRVDAVEFPKLDNPAHQNAIIETVAKHHPDVVIIDPLYRALGGLDTARVSEVGECLVNWTKCCAPAMPIFAHHVTKVAARGGGPPSLEDLSGAGLAESCGNWWLVGRNEPYQFDKMHDLAVVFGGRDEQAGFVQVVFNEADWTFEVSSGADLKDKQQTALNKKKQADQQTKLNVAKAGVKHALANVKEPKPKSWIEVRSGSVQWITRLAIAELLNDGTLVSDKYIDEGGKGKSGGLILAASLASLSLVKPR